jgi:hypothetical protein
MMVLHVGLKGPALEDQDLLLVFKDYVHAWAIIDFGPVDLKHILSSHSTRQ